MTSATPDKDSSMATPSDALKMQIATALERLSLALITASEERAPRALQEALIAAHSSLRKAGLWAYPRVSPFVERSDSQRESPSDSPDDSR